MKYPIFTRKQSILVQENQRMIEKCGREPEKLRFDVKNERYCDTNVHELVMCGVEAVVYTG